MADDIFLTPEEQDERARQWLKDNGMALGLGIALGLGAVFGYQQWQEKLVRDAEAASALYNTALSTFRTTELADISAQVDELKADYTGSPYAVKASLLRARQLSASDLDAAVAELQWAAANADEPGLLHAAQIRLAKILIEQEKLDQAAALANANSDSDYASHYAEVLGDVARLSGEYTEAAAQYQKALDGLAQQDIGYSAILNLKLNRLPVSAPEESTDSESVEDAASETVSE